MHASGSLLFPMFYRIVNNIFFLTDSLFLGLANLFATYQLKYYVLNKEWLPVLIHAELKE